MSISKQKKKVKPTEKNKGGRPKEPISGKVDFNTLSLLAQRGFTDREIAAVFRVDERTINRWKKDEQFMSVLKRAKDMANENVERSLYERALGYSHAEDKIFQYEGSPVVVPTTKHYPPDPVAAIFWLKNRKPAEWRDKQEVEHSGQIKTISETTSYSLKTKKTDK